jgi:hypothetical protein
MFREINPSYLYKNKLAEMSYWSCTTLNIIIDWVPWYLKIIGSRESNGSCYKRNVWPDRLIVTCPLHQAPSHPGSVSASPPSPRHPAPIVPIYSTMFFIKIFESASRSLVGFGVLNDNLIKCLISFVEVHEQILSNRYKGIHGYITRSTIMMKMELCD